MSGDALEIEVPRHQVLRYMGYPRKTAPSERVARLVQRRWSEALALVAARGAWRIVERAAARGAGMPDPSEVVGLGLCTIGEGVEQAARACSTTGDLLGALFLDAFGSSAAEAAADALNRRLCAEAHQRGYQLQPRISPGYGRWAIEHQPRLLALLPARALGITLTEGLMMIPRKSVSFATRAAIDDGIAPRDRRRCCRCELLTCPYRDEDEER